MSYDLAADCETHPSGDRGFEIATIVFPRSRAKFIRNLAQDHAPLVSALVAASIEAWAA